MTVQEFVDLVGEMRRAQRAYFCSRLPTDLDRARMYEIAVDRALRAAAVPAAGPPPAPIAPTPPPEERPPNPYRVDHQIPLGFARR